MGETVNIAKMADIVADDIFSMFGWDMSDFTNQNWDCVMPEKHGKVLDENSKGKEKKERKSEKKTHPSDLVLSIEDPYRERRCFFNVDLKSYGEKSISKTAVSSAIRSLAKSVQCANQCKEWRDLFAKQVDPHVVHGLLFIYNHDSEYDKNFDKTLAALNTSFDELALDQKVYVMGPKRIAYLYSVAQDIKNTMFDAGLNKESAYYFLIPDSYLHRPRSQRREAASIEHLLAPWLIVQWEIVQGKKVKYLTNIYYYEDGSAPDEFVYLLDFCFRNNIVLDNSEIFVKPIFPHKDAAAHFTSAQAIYAKEFYSDKGFENRINRIKYKSVSITKYRFSELELSRKKKDNE
jgi:hypothetical protein